MLYYRVKNDNTFIVNFKTKEKHWLIKNELLTVAELSDYTLTGRQLKTLFDCIEISRTKVYWTFGTRFIQKGYENEAKIQEISYAD